MPARAVLALGAGDLLLVVVDVEVVPGEALVPSVLAGGVALQRPADGDLVFTGGLFQVGQGGAVGIEQVPDGRHSATRQSGMDAGGRTWLDTRSPQNGPHPSLTVNSRLASARVACPSGFACIYPHSNFRGQPYIERAVDGNMAHLSDCIRNAGSSVINNTHKAVQIRQKGNYKDRRVCVGPNGGSIQDCRPTTSMTRRNR